MGSEQVVVPEVDTRRSEQGLPQRGPVETRGLKIECRRRRLDGLRQAERGSSDGLGRERLGLELRRTETMSRRRSGGRDLCGFRKPFAQTEHRPAKTFLGIRLDEGSCLRLHERLAVEVACAPDLVVVRPHSRKRDQQARQLTTGHGTLKRRLEKSSGPLGVTGGVVRVRGFDDSPPASAFVVLRRQRGGTLVQQRTRSRSAPGDRARSAIVDRTRDRLVRFDRRCGNVPRSCLRVRQELGESRVYVRPTQGIGHLVCTCGEQRVREEDTGPVELDDT